MTDDVDHEIEEARRYERGLLTKGALAILLASAVALLHELALRVA